MNQVLDKLGIYDLVAVLLSGICIVTFSAIADKALFQSELLDSLKIDDTLIFLVVSYFVGLLFQEVGSALQKEIFQKNNNLLKRALDTAKVPTHQFLTSEEKNNVSQIIQKELALENPPDISLLYNYCKYYLVINGCMVSADKNQSISGLSRSLSLYFLVLFAFVGWKAVVEANITYFACAIGILGLSIIFGYRCTRFIRMRYVDIIRTFYYKYIQTQTQDDKSHSRKCISSNDCK